MHFSPHTFSGALTAVVLASWGVLLWTHFDQAFMPLIIPGIIGIIIVAGIEVLAD